MHRCRQAITLVELLVSISIIGILMGLLIPAVNSARESARNTQCKNNLRQLGLAMTNHFSARQVAPGYIDDYGTWTPGAGDPSDPSNTFARRHAKIASWAVSLFPYLDQQALHERWTEDRYPVLTNNNPVW
ncbi:MAG: DUF1559 domain-containing protein, partial [Rubripirellula sp.]